jgi:hypothetical protein
MLLSLLGPLFAVLFVAAKVVLRSQMSKFFAALLPWVHEAGLGNIPAAHCMCGMANIMFETCHVNCQTLDQLAPEHCKAQCSYCTNTL